MTDRNTELTGWAHGDPVAYAHDGATVAGKVHEVLPTFLVVDREGRRDYVRAEHLVSGPPARVLNDAELTEAANTAHVECAAVAGVHEVDGGTRDAYTGAAATDPHGAHDPSGGDFGWRIYRSATDGRHVVTWTDGVCGQWAVVVTSEREARLYLDLLAAVVAHDAGCEDGARLLALEVTGG